MRTAPDTLEPWQLEPSLVEHDLETSAADGLSASAVRRRWATHGPNELLKTKSRPSWRLLADQFTSPMILVLMAAALITVAIGEPKDSVVILAIVVLNGVVGFVQEFRAERAMDALMRMSTPQARVIRDGETRTLPAREVVPGDIILIEQGDVVPADARLTQAPGLRVDESALTGESEPVTKVTEALPDVHRTAIAEQRNMVLSGTAVTAGRGEGIVVATGMGTRLGEVAALLQVDGGGTTPLQVRLAELGKWLAVAAIAICSLVFVAGIMRGEEPQEMFLVAVSLAVAAIPEGLPAVVTISLALGARRMARKGALVRRLPAVETLGSVSVICTDKTGTLTQNRMLAERLWTPEREYDISGRGYDPYGQLEPNPSDDGYAVRAAHVAAACNDATLVPPGEESGGDWTMNGDPTEAALLALAAKLGVHRHDIDAWCPRVAELGFDAERRRMATLHVPVAERPPGTDDMLRSSSPRGPAWVAVKGALESLAPLLADDQGQTLQAARQVADRYARSGYRVLALADADIESIPEAPAEAEHRLRLVGIVGMADPPRETVRRSIDRCRTAGIRVVMITGDHPVTAETVAHRLGLLQGDAERLQGDELAALDDSSFAEQVEHIAVYARTNPEQKLRIVDAWRGRGAVTAMTGDGVNDAPALRRADIGVAMGITGTDVTKEAADMILSDDDFSTIVAAVEEGRRIYANIRHFVRYMLTTNSAEVWVMVLAPLVGLPLPLLAVQILWMNLVTDGPPALFLAMEPAHGNAMTRPPRRSDASIIGAGLWQHAVWVGLFMAALALVLQAVGLRMAWPWQTMVFSALAFMQLAHALAVRSERESTLRLGLTTNLPLLATVVVSVLIQLALIYVPQLQPIFETQALAVEPLLAVALVSPLPFLAVEAEKWFLRRRDQRVSVGI